MGLPCNKMPCFDTDCHLFPQMPEKDKEKSASAQGLLDPDGYGRKLEGAKKRPCAEGRFFNAQGLLLFVRISGHRHLGRKAYLVFRKAAFTTLFGFPERQDLMLSARMRRMFCLAGRLAQAMCGVIKVLGA